MLWLARSVYAVMIICGRKYLSVRSLLYTSEQRTYGETVAVNVNAVFPSCASLRFSLLRWDDKDLIKTFEGLVWLTGYTTASYNTFTFTFILRLISIVIFGHFQQPSVRPSVCHSQYDN